MFPKTLGGCAIVAFMILVGAALTSNNSCAADLPLRIIKAVAPPDAPLSPEGRKQLLQEFRQFLRERGQPR